MRSIIQVAGVCNLEEARMLLNAGVDWLGFPFHLPVHSEDLSIAEAAQIVRSVDATRCVLITYLKFATEISTALSTLSVNKVQLHGSITISEVAMLKQMHPGLFIIKSLIVGRRSEDELTDSAEKFSPFVDAFITDTYDPVSGACGATGKTHDWNVSRRLVEVSSRPVILAGGLSPENVAEAIRVVHPAGVDVHTGLEDALGKKDPQKVSAFVTAARTAGL
jgi:phosphoribosylanthranilate isomerase